MSVQSMSTKCGFIRKYKRKCVSKMVPGKLIMWSQYFRRIRHQFRPNAENMTWNGMVTKHKQHLSSEIHNSSSIKTPKFLDSFVNFCNRNLPKVTKSCGSKCMFMPRFTLLPSPETEILKEKPKGGKNGQTD